MNRPITLLTVLILMLFVFVGCSAPAAPAASAPAADAPAADAPATDVTESTATTDNAPAAAISSTEALSESVPAEAPASTETRGLRTFTIVPSESTASYSADEEFFADALTKYGIGAGKQDTIGSTQEISGVLTLDLDNLGDALGDNHFTVQLNTLASDQGLRDGFIRTNGPNFNKYPEALFVATSIEGAPGTYSDGDEVHFQLGGDMTIREITMPVTFDVAARLTGNILTGVAEAQMLMSDFGIEQLNFLNTLTVADPFGVKIEFTAQSE